jgi:pentatricopeptide repeat protein
MCREGKIEDAVDVLMDLVSGQLDDSVQPDTVTYNIIIDSCGKSGMASKAEKLVQNMRSYGLRPDNATYTALIDAYGKAGEPDKVIGIVNFLVSALPYVTDE